MPKFSIPHLSWFERLVFGAGSIAIGIAVCFGCANVPPTALPKTAPTALPKTATARYSCALVQIDRPEAMKERYGPVVTIQQEPENKYVYEDGLFAGVFCVMNSRVTFVITNKTEHSIKIVWDQAAFIEVGGESGRLAHHGVKYADRNASQPSSVIPRGSSLSDFVLPTNRIYYRQGSFGRYYSSPGGWEELPLVLPASRSIADGDAGAAEAFASEATTNKGKRFGVLLPFEIQGVLNEYTFWFEVQEASVILPASAQRPQEVAGPEAARRLGASLGLGVGASLGLDAPKAKEGSDEDSAGSASLRKRHQTDPNRPVQAPEPPPEPTPLERENPPAVPE